LSMMATTSKKSVLKKIIVYFSLFVKNALYFLYVGYILAGQEAKTCPAALMNNFRRKLRKKNYIL
jgi:hypothetical protein